MEIQDSNPMPIAERLTRVSVPALDALLGERFAVLNDGFVRVIDYMGDDAAVVQAARVSYGKGTRKINEDRGLIRYLMRHQHTTPFEMCEIKLHLRVPMDCWRQWIRHRTANVNEYSTRYSLAIDSQQVTAPESWRLQAQSNRQGSAGYLSEEQGLKLTQAETELHAHALATYQERIAQGVAREQARKDLPLATYTEAYWKVDLHNLLHFLALRMDAHAQQEIREYASLIGEKIVAKWCPLVWEAFQDYRLQAIHFSNAENQLIALLIQTQTDEAIELAQQLGWLGDDKQPKKNRERIEFEAKIKSWGLQLPWLS